MSTEIPKKIRMTDKNSCARQIMTRHDGEDYTITRHNGMTIIHIANGDYTGIDCHANQQWLRDNPDMWETYPDSWAQFCKL